MFAYFTVRKLRVELMRQRKSLFAYLAYDEGSGLLLAHGSTAVEALDQADRLDPNAAIFIVHSKNQGESIWKSKLTLSVACQITDHSQRDSRPKPPSLQPIHESKRFGISSAQEAP
jgi:hypothetical protein